MVASTVNLNYQASRESFKARFIDLPSMFLLAQKWDIIGGVVNCGGKW